MILHRRKHKKPKNKQQQEKLHFKMHYIIPACKQAGLYCLHADKKFVFYNLSTGFVLAQCHENDNWLVAFDRAVTRKNDGRN